MSNAQRHYEDGQENLARAEALQIMAQDLDHNRPEQQHLLFDANVYVQRAKAHFAAALVGVTAHPAQSSLNPSYSPGDFT